MEHTSLVEYTVKIILWRIVLIVKCFIGVKHKTNYPLSSYLHGFGDCLMSQGDMYDPRGGGVPLQKGIHGKYVLN